MLQPNINRGEGKKKAIEKRGFARQADLTASFVRLQRQGGVAAAEKSMVRNVKVPKQKEVGSYESEELNQAKERKRWGAECLGSYYDTGGRRRKAWE